jgi:hypothetical protein
VRLLSPARAGGSAIGLGSGRGTTVRLAIALAVGGDSGLNMQRVGKGGLGHATERLASGALVALLVGCEVKGDEENQVGA